MVIIIAREKAAAILYTGYTTTKVVDPSQSP